MTGATRYDSWSAGDSYDLFMGRWSRAIAPLFLDWLSAPPGARWLDVGCGTGALSAAIVARCAPAELCGVDPSEAFVARARKAVSGESARFIVGDAQALGLADASVDVAVSGLALNFVPDRALALSEMRRVARPRGRVGFYVWDYPGGGVEFLRAFWTAAVALDPGAADLSEVARFPFCTRDALAAFARACGLRDVEGAALEAPAVFADFEDFWRPFTLGAGPAPGYCSSLAPDARERLRSRLRETLPADADGRIALRVRAWGIKGAA
ncbi:MAG: methyltransferase domain-containing protein [Pseudomonadota bacterium]